MQENSFQVEALICNWSTNLFAYPKEVLMILNCACFKEVTCESISPEHRPQLLDIFFSSSFLFSGKLESEGDRKDDCHLHRTQEG